MNKTLRVLATAVVSAGLVTPFLVQAKSVTVDDAPGKGKSVVSSWVKALDGEGDANAIGKFKSALANKKLKTVNGIVSAVSATSITVTKGDKDYTFVVDETTKVIRKYKGTASIDEVAVGDKVQIWATKKAEGTAKLIWDKSIWHAQVKGAVSELDSVNKTFTVVITKTEPHTGLPMTMNMPVRTTDDTTYFIGDTAAAFTDLANGETVTVRGTWNFAGQYLTASKVTIAQ